MKSMNAVMLSALAVLSVAVEALGGTTFVWSGGSGRWSEAANWTVGGNTAMRAPGCDAGIVDDIANFDPSEDATVEVDCDVLLDKMGSAAHVGREEIPVLTFVGGHRIVLTANENSASVRPRFLEGVDVRFGNVELVANYLDINGIGHFEAGSSVCVSNAMYAFAAGARIYFENGCRVQTPNLGAQAVGSGFVFSGGELTGLDGVVGFLKLDASGSTAVVNAGYVKVRPSLSSGAAFYLRGGVVDAAGSYALPGFPADATFEFTGGTLRTQYDIPAGDLRYFGGKDTVLDCLSQNSTAIQPMVVSNATASFGGTLYLTNAASARWTFDVPCTVNGKGKIYGGSVFMGNKCEVNWDLDTLALGGQFYQGTLTSCVFGDDLTLRPYGSSWAGSNYTSTFELGGKVKADTLDCKDNATARTITIPRASPRPGTSLEVTGGGVFEWKQCDIVRPIGDVVVRQGSTLRLFGPLSAASLTLEANAKVEMRADSSMVSASQPPYIEARTFTLDPTATISYKLPASPAAEAYPLVSRPNGGDVSALAAQIAVDVNGNSAYTVRTSGSIAFLWNGTEPTRTFTPGNDQYLWTGASTANDKWFTAENWYNSSVPGYSASAQAYIGGMARQTINWNWYTNYRTTRWKFLPTCGPMTVSDGPVNAIAYSDYNANPNFVSESRFPVVFKDGLKSAGRVSIAASNSYVTVLGTVTSASGLYVGGDVRFGGQSTVPGEFNFFAGLAGGRESRLEILPGGSLTIRANKSFYTQTASIVVDENATLTYAAGEGNVYGWNAKSWVAERVHAIDGTMSVMCPLAGGRVQRYRGTGTLHVESTRSDTAGNCEVNLGGGITFTSGGFNTVTADSSGHYVRLAIVGEATLKADKPWTYGPVSGVATTTTVDDRALAVRECATLTIDTPTHAITLADPIRGKGKLKFASGAKLVLDERLPKRGRWTEIATVGSVEGEPVLGGENKFACVANADGTVTFLTKPATGLTILVR